MTTLPRKTKVTLALNLLEEAIGGADAMMEAFRNAGGTPEELLLRLSPATQYSIVAHHIANSILMALARDARTLENPEWNVAGHA